MGKRKSLINQSVRMTQDLHNKNSELASKTGVSVSEIIRKACEQFNESTAHVEKCRKLIVDSKLSDMQLIRFAGIKTALNLYIHKNAFTDLKNNEKKKEDEVMEFMRSSIENGTLLSKGELKFSDRTSIMKFRVNTLDVYCHIGPAQVTILSVV